MPGYCAGEDIEASLTAGTIDRASYDAQQRDRVRDRQRLLNALVAENLLPAHHERDAERVPKLTPDLHSAVMGYLAQTPCVMWLVNQEDMTQEPHQQNLPGTTAEYPNWSRKMRWSLEDLSTLPDALGTVEMIRHWVERTGRTRD
jgi:4-alpha-glucanotransferase